MSGPHIKDAGGELVRHADGSKAAIDMSRADIVLLTGAYCPRGCPLITEESQEFDGFAGIGLMASDGRVSGRLMLSPFQGDSRKQGPAFDADSILTLTCPTCDAELDIIGPCDCGEGGAYVALYTVRVPDPDYVVGVCRRWGCFRSFVKDAGKIVTEYRVGPLRGA